MKLSYRGKTFIIMLLFSVGIIAANMGILIFLSRL